MRTRCLKQSFLFFSAIFGLSILLWAQQADIRGTVGKTGEKPAVAVADMRGTGVAQAFMDAFNRTLYSELQDSGRLKMIPKTVYPLTVPQQPSDFHQPHPWLTDWSGPPVSANYLAFGYTAVQGNQLVLFGWFYDVSQQTTQSAQVLGKLYFGSLDQAGAIKVARRLRPNLVRYSSQYRAPSRTTACGPPRRPAGPVRRPSAEPARPAPRPGRSRTTC